MPEPLERARDLGGRSSLDLNVLATAYRGDRTLSALNIDFLGLEVRYFLSPNGSCLGNLGAQKLLAYIRTFSVDLCTPNFNPSFPLI